MPVVVGASAVILILVILWDAFETIVLPFAPIPDLAALALVARLLSAYDRLFGRPMLHRWVDTRGRRQGAGW